MANLTYRGINYQHTACSKSSVTQLYPGKYRGSATTIPTTESICQNQHKQSLVYRGVTYAPVAQLQPAF